MANDKNQQKPDADVNRRKKEEQARRGRRRNRQLIGAALAILIVVGVFSIIERGFGLVGRLLDDTAEKDAFKSRIGMMVRFEMLPFPDPSLANQDALKQIIIWSIYFDQKDDLERTVETAETAGGNALVPALEVNRYAASLFGSGFLFAEHAPFSETLQGMNYGFDEAKQAYIMPVTALEADYVPTIVEIKREGSGVKRVVVGYVNTRGAFDEYITPDEANPAYYYDYLFRRDGNEYYLFALEPSQMMINPPSSSSPSSATSSSHPEEEEELEESTSIPEASSTSEASSGDESALEDDSSTTSIALPPAA